MNTLSFSIKDCKYDISYENLTEDGMSIEADNISVKKNGVVTDEPGESFAGHKYTPAEMFERTVLEYINNSNISAFSCIPDDIKALKDKYFKPYATKQNNREVPESYYAGGLDDPAGVQMITDKYVAYAGNDKYILTDSEGTVLTDIEAFWTSGAMVAYKDTTILYIAPEMKIWLDELLSDE